MVETAPSRKPTATGLLLLVLVLLATVPVVASAVRLGPDWVPQGDDATIALRGDDLFTGHTPLVGMPSTVGDAVDAQVHHPGPLESQAIGLLAAVGENPRDPLIVVTLVNLAAIVVALVWALRLGGPPLLAASAVVVAALTWSLRGPILVTPFNPYVAVLPWLACLVSLIAACARRPWAVTSAVLFGSWAAQAHLTTTGPVGAAALAAGAIALVGWGVPTTLLDRRRFYVGLGVTAMVWAFPIADVVANEGGNPRALLRASGSLEDETIGAGKAVDVIVHAVALRPVWAQAGAGPLDLLQEPSRFEVATAALLLLLAALVAVRCRRERPAVTTAIVLVTASLLAGGALTAKIPQSFFNTFALHNYLWLWPASAVLWVATAAGLVHLVARRLRWRPPAAAPLVAGLALAALIAVAGVAPPHRGSGAAASTYVRALQPQVLAALAPDGAFLVDLDPAIDVYGLGTGLLYALEHAGYDVRVPAPFEPSFGRHRIVDDAPRQRIVVRLGRDRGAPPSADAVPVATYDPPADLLERRARAEDALVAELERRGGTTVAGGTEITALEARAWVESGEFLSAWSFRLLEPSLADAPESRAVADLADEPLGRATVYLVPAP
ncbi:MAG: hypothetical protein ABL966_01375 [Acidimicrobiales bacterium]